MTPLEEHYSAVRAKFFPRGKAIVRAHIPPADPNKDRRLRHIERGHLVFLLDRDEARLRLDIADRIVDGYRIGRAMVASTTKPTRPLSVIIAEVALKYGFSVDDIKSHRRQPKLAKARHEFYEKAITGTSHSISYIARFCGGRDHTTLLKFAKTRGILRGPRE